MYNIVMFAHNEEQNIDKSIASIFANVDHNLNAFFIIANGCTDKTVSVIAKNKALLDFEKLIVVELSLGDKCNAWNHYVHSLAGSVDTHFFVDADVKFSPLCFPKMATYLNDTKDTTVTVAGLPLSGRNSDFYQQLVVERACFFGNLYGLKHSFIQRIQSVGFRLPMGLNWIDSFLTKAVNTDLNFFNYNLPDRVTYLENTGYYFDSLSLFNKSDIKLYVNRIARYELGKIQEVHLDKLPVADWPKSLEEINNNIATNFPCESRHLNVIKRALVKKRLKKLLK
jgi:glycosyltransferase involved in cell wall biosynthesis